MRAIKQVRCPNCGTMAEREHLPAYKSTTTACPACEYFLMSCVLTGNVLECSSPGIYASKRV